MVKVLPRRVPRAAPATEGQSAFDRRGVVVFYLITLALSWGWTISLLAGEATVEKGEGWPTHFPALLGPMLAAVAVTTWRAGRSGVRDLGSRMVAWRAPWTAWLVALSPALFLAIALAGLLITGNDLPEGSDFGVFSGLPRVGVVGVFLLITVVNGFGEETGWRGFALPHLQRRFSPLSATFLVLGMWVAWHVPYFFVLASYENLQPVELVGFALGITAGAVILTWLYNRSGGSILLPVIWHGVYNFVGATAAATGTVAAVVATMILVHGAVLLALEVRARQNGHPSVIGPVIEG